MQTLLSRLKALPDHYLMVAALILFFPAHLICLGLAAFNGDEAIRAWVAMEIDFSGNYIATTMHGAPYLNKPPLFNWMILAVTKLMGGYDEWPSRLITVFFLGVFGWSIFRFVRRELNPETGFLAAMMTVTSGRFLFYDSMLGLIDTTYSWTVFLLFMSIYFFGRREQWLNLFLSTYFLTAIGFMLKGFPAFVFQGLSLPAGLFFFRKPKILFSWQHGAGILLLAGILGAYLAAYAQYRPLEALIPNLLHESVKRTVVEHTLWNTVVHTFQFPFDSLYHFLPFSLLLVLWFDRGLWPKIRSNDFVFFCFVMLAVNLPVYWTSSQVMPRYLLMFIPLFNLVGLYLLDQNRTPATWRYRTLYYLLEALLVFGPLAMAAMPFVDQVNWLPNIVPVSVILTLAMTLVTVMYFVDGRRFLWWFILAMLIVRIGFDLIILPVRHHENDTSIARRDAIQLAEKHRDRRWYVWADSETREPAMFYATAKLGYIIERTDRRDIPNALYLVNLRQYPDFDGKCLDTLRTDYKTTTLLLMVTDE